jgi:hypothetical protein
MGCTYVTLYFTLYVRQPEFYLFYIDICIIINITNIWPNSFLGLVYDDDKCAQLRVIGYAIWAFFQKQKSILSYSNPADLVLFAICHLEEFIPFNLNI